MHLIHHDSVSRGQLHLLIDQPDVERRWGARQLHPLMTIAWNRGAAQRAWVDEVPVELPAGAFLTLVTHQSFRFERTSGLVLWQFDRPFYCIIEHDAEVSCVGLLFYGASSSPVVRAAAAEQREYAAMLDVFVDELRTRDAMQADMLRMLLKRLVIKLTRLARAQLVPPTLAGTELDLVRRFHVCVEDHFRAHHRVADYAAMLNRSAKTLSNLFARHGQPSPLRLIHARLSLEARRLLRYTDRPVKQVAGELGFTDVTSFGRFFRAETGVSPAAFRREAVADARVVAVSRAGNRVHNTGNPALRMVAGER